MTMAIRPTGQGNAVQISVSKLAQHSALTRYTITRNHQQPPSPDNAHNSPTVRFIQCNVSRISRARVALAFVAVWRVAWLVFYLRRSARLPWYSVAVATLLPITIVVTVLTAVNLERAVFDVMGRLPRRRHGRRQCVRKAEQALCRSGRFDS